MSACPNQLHYLMGLMGPYMLLALIYETSYKIIQPKYLGHFYGTLLYSCHLSWKK
jgi:hypothetical protein